MRLRVFAATLSLFALEGCAWFTTKSTVNLSNSVGEIYRQQVIYNLKAFIDDPNAIPSGVNLTSGSVLTTQGGNAGATVPLGDNNTIVTNPSGTSTTLVQPTPALTFGLNGSLTENWSLNPVTDPGAIARLKALYRFVTVNKRYLDASGSDSSVTPEMNAAFLAEYPIPYLTKEVSVPIYIKCKSDTGGKPSATPCSISTTEEIQYPDPQGVNFPNCGVCEVTFYGKPPSTTNYENGVSVGGQAVLVVDELGPGGARLAASPGSRCARLDPTQLGSSPYDHIDYDKFGSKRYIMFFRNCTLNRWLLVADRGTEVDDTRYKSLGTVDGQKLFVGKQIANPKSTDRPYDNPTAFSDFTLFVLNASRPFSTPAAASSASGGKGSS